MATTRSLVRRRSVLVAGAALLTAVTATGSVSAHEGGPAGGTLHACALASTGALRVLADGSQECRRNETPLHWTVGDGSDEGLATFREQLATAGSGGLVDWTNLVGVPDALADGLVSPGEVFGPSSPLADGAVSLADLVDLPAWLADGTLSYSDLGSLPDGFVNGAAIADGSVGASDLAGSDVPGAEVIGAVTSAKIADGSVEPRDLRPEVASVAVGPGSIALSSSATELGTAGVLARDGSLVMVSGQVQLAWTAPCTACTDVVSYRVTRDGAPVSPVYRVQLSPQHTQDVATIAFLDTVGAGDVFQYGLLLSTENPSSGISASSLVLTAQVLGGS